MTDELWDLLDENRKPLNKTWRRADGGRPEGAYHLVVAIWTFNRKGELLTTKRAPQKDWPDSWENTAGSALSGETSVQAAARELWEETGVIASGGLTLFAEIKERAAFIDMYFAVADSDALVLQPEETTAGKWVSLEEFERMIAAGDVCAPVARRYEAYRDTIRGFRDEHVRR